MPKRATSTSFKPGQSGNPNGRPPGIQETRPRGYVKAAIDTVLAKDPTLLPTAIRRGLKNEEYARGFVELVARVCKEIGGNPAQDPRPVIFHFHTNLNPMALAGSGQPRSLPPAPSAPAAPPSRPSKRAGAKPPGGSP